MSLNRIFGLYNYHDFLNCILLLFCIYQYSDIHRGWSVVNLEGRNTQKKDRDTFKN